MTVGELKTMLAGVPDDLLVVVYDMDDTSELHPAQCGVEDLVVHQSEGGVWLHAPGRKQAPDTKAFVLF